MDNFSEEGYAIDSETGELYRVMSRSEALACMYEYVDTLPIPRDVRDAYTAQGEHWREHGHALEFGCCAA